MQKVSSMSLLFRNTMNRDVSLLTRSSRCVYCHSGGYNLCTDTIFAGTPPGDGTLQKYFIAASDFCYPLPPNMNAEDGALIEPVAVAVSICKTAGLKAGQTVLVFGCGSIGVLTQAVAKAHGVKVIGINRSSPRALFAKSFGPCRADDVFVPKQSSAPVANSINASRDVADQIIRKFDLGDGADAVLECTGAESFIQAGIFATPLGGTYVQAGFDKEVGWVLVKSTSPFSSLTHFNRMPCFQSPQLA